LIAPEAGASSGEWGIPFGGLRSFVAVGTMKKSGRREGGREGGRIRSLKERLLLLLLRWDELD
jgi:hypothetical protein